MIWFIQKAINVSVEMQGKERKNVVYLAQRKNPDNDQQN